MTRRSESRIIDEIRAIRDAMAKDCGYDVERLAQMLNSPLNYRREQPG